jgi:hypothetical protein
VKFLPKPSELIDRIVSDLLALKSILEGRTPDAPNMDPEEELIDTWTASQRFDQPIDSVRWAAREKGIGVKVGTRWMISLAKAREYYAENG